MPPSATYRIVCLLALTAALGAAASAQRQRPYNELGVAVGGMNYIGDLNNQSMFGTVNMAGSVFFRHNINDRWAIAVQGSYGTLEGGDPDAQRWRNLSFKSTLWEGAIRIEFNFVSLGFTDVQYRTSPYLFCGIGVFGYNPMAYYTDPKTGQGSWVELQPLGTEGQFSSLYPDAYPYSRTTICIPFGIGFKARLSKEVSLSVEYGFRKTWTDYIDDVSTQYVSDDAFADNAIALALADRSAEAEGGHKNAPRVQRGDDTLKDWYSYFNVTLAIGTDVLFGWMKSKRCYPDEK